MLQLIIVIALIAVAAYAAYSAKTPEGWDIKKGLLAIVSAAVAAATWFWGLFHAAPPPV
jgi:hypothetical protein